MHANPQPGTASKEARSAPWRCASCIEEAEGVSIGDLRRSGVVFSEPKGPDDVCTCGNRPSEIVRARLLVEHLARQAAPAAERRSPSVGLGVNAAARMLKRSKATIGRWVADGTIKTVPWAGKKTRFLIPTAEVERIVKEGLSRPEPVPAAAKRRRARNGAPGSREEREAAVAAILAHGREPKPT